MVKKYFASDEGFAIFCLIFAIVIGITATISLV